MAMMNEPSPVARPASSLWVLTAELTLVSAAHLGSGSDEGVLCRDALTGAPLLTGAALAGALRATRAGGRVGSRAPDATDREIARLFGGGADDGPGRSALTVCDSVGQLPEGGVERRSGLSVEAGTGQMSAGSAYSFSVLPAGTRFPLRFELRAATDDETAQLTALAVVLDGLDGRVRIGGRTARGLGVVRTGAWRAVRFDLSSATGWREWLLTDPARPVPDWVAAHGDARTALRDSGAPIEAKGPPADARRRFVAALDLQVEGALLVGGVAEATGGAAVHPRAGGVSVLPGSTLTGALRARALRISRLVRAEQGDAEWWMRRLFGSAGDDQGGKMAARLSVSEPAITDGIRLRGSRTAIDRFTGGAVDVAPAREEAAYGGHVTVALEVRDPMPGEEGFVLLLIKDLAGGLLPVGGTTSIGRGVLRGTATVTLADGATGQFGDEVTMDAEGRAMLDEAVGAFWSAPVLQGVER